MLLPYHAVRFNVEKRQSIGPVSVRVSVRPLLCLSRLAFTCTQSNSAGAASLRPAYVSVLLSEGRRTR